MHDPRHAAASRAARRLAAAAAALALAWAHGAELSLTRPGGGGLPAEVTAGYVAVRVDTGEDASVTLFRLHPGVDRAAFEAAVGATGADGDFVAALNAALDLVDVVLEVGARAGVPASAGAVLAPGEYALAYQSLSEEGPAAATTYSYVTVVPGDGDAPPDVVGTVHADEFLFALPAGLAAGEQTWAVTNVGGQLHNMVLFRLDAGATAADLRAWLLGGGGPPPATEAGVVGLFGPGETVYQTLDLAPGAYVAACFVPHHGPGGDGAPHFQHGMLQPFTVGD